MNRLQFETSPYLLQHANNPVNWFAWKPEAFEKAKKEDKPILVSIGYSTCHWCHVMEKESFENEEVAAFMNHHFVNIKVDREERPDVDQIYMEACQAISGSGGWPLNCFLTPDGRPYYAGTYFPPEPAFRRPSWLQVLNNMQDAYRNKKDTVEKQANRLMDYIKRSERVLLKEDFEPISFPAGSKDSQEKVFNGLKDRFDTQDGGFGSAPKFPNTMSLRYLLAYYHFSKNEDALEHALFSIDKMIMGGIYDQLGGGFSRYTVDKAWLVPHFEKMLYDNALLLLLVAEAYQITGKELYKQTIHETLTYIKREMMSPEGGFYSAQDADSEGEEGKFYVWSKKEIDSVLGEAAELFCEFYDVSEQGNWEHKNILWRKETFEAFATRKGVKTEDLMQNLSSARQQLFKVRDQRIYPGLDDKILLGWNALMCRAVAKAAAVLEDQGYEQIAVRNLDFLLKNFKKEQGNGFYHTYKEGQKQYDAFLDDYANLINAILAVYELTFDFELLKKAEEIADWVIERFYDADDHLFFFTSAEQTDLILRKKELYDSATPSGNSMMLDNIRRLAILSDRDDYRQISQNMMVKISKAVENYPSSFSLWAISLLNEEKGNAEIAIIGPDYETLATNIRKRYLPNKVLMASNKPNSEYALLAGKPESDETLIYLCENYACQIPVKTIAELEQLMN